ncbi:MAG: hypothetical protein BJ554DRAFT_6160, partial [Olpidium bornovanus]
MFGLVAKLKGSYFWTSLKVGESGVTPQPAGLLGGAHTLAPSFPHPLLRHTHTPCGVFVLLARH